MKQKSILLLIMILAISVFTLVGCKKAEEPVTTNPSVTDGNKEEIKDTEDPVVETPEVKEPVEVTITHEYGDATFLQEPKKIIVFDYATLDSVRALGYKENIIGLPKSNIPEYLSEFNDDQYTDVGTLFEPNYEKIAELAPDVILISARQAKLYDEFKAIAPTVFLPMASADYFTTFFANLDTLGQIFGKEAEVSAIEEELKVALQAVNEKASALDEKAFVVMSNEGSLSAFGPNSRFGVLYNDFGFKAADENIDESTHGQNMSYEFILELNPDYLFMIDRGIITGGDSSVNTTLDNDVIKMTEAYKNDRIIYLDAFVWYVSAGGIDGTKIMINEMENALSK